MSAITFDETIFKKLPMLHESTEIRDEDGNVLGVFTPIEEECQVQKIPQHLLDKFDHAEIERRSQSKERGRTTAEVLQRLEAIEKSSLACRIRNIPDDRIVRIVQVVPETN